MKGIIDKNGWLFIQRPHKMKPIYCPYDARVNDEGARCGDWCPMFDDPVRLITGWEVGLCQTILLFDELTDERKKRKAK